VQPVHLINASGEKVHVLVDGRRRQLPRISEPCLLSVPDTAGSVAWPVLARPGPTGAPAEVRMYGESAVLGTLHEPPVVDGVRYLVEPEVLAEFPHRTDFVTAAMWQLDVRALKRRTGKSTGKSKGKSRGRLKVRAILVGVTRSPLVVGGPNTPATEIAQRADLQ